MAFTKLDPEFKTKWLQALRSGKYEQTTVGALRVKDQSTGKVSYCCLGVGCNLVNHRRWNRQSDHARRHGGFDWGDIDTDSTRLPFVDYDAACVLATQNDSGEPFDKIANWIEKNL